MKRSLFILTGILVFAVSYAQNGVAGSYDALRNQSWSVYGRAGVSVTGGGDLLPGVGTTGLPLSAFGGVGADFNITPAFRLGLGYDFLSYSREQRFSAVQADGLSYRKLTMMAHSLDLRGMGNLMELFSGDRNKRFNLYLGAGAGYMYGYGIDYTIRTTEQEVTGVSSVSFTSLLQTKNTHVGAGSPYIPVELSAEYDISPLFTLALVGSARFLTSTSECLPRVVGLAGVALRVNLVGEKHGYQTRSREVAALNQTIEDLRSGKLENEDQTREVEASRARMVELLELLEAKQKEVDALKKQLAEASSSASQPVRDLQLEKEADKLLESCAVYFGFDRYDITEEGARTVRTIADFLKKHPSILVEIVGSADSSGPDTYNLELSRKRTRAVEEALIAQGVDPAQIVGHWIGESGMTRDPRCRRVYCTQKK